MVIIRKFALVDFIKISNSSDNYIVNYFNNLVKGKSMFEKLIAVENMVIFLEEKEIKGFINVENYYDDIYTLKDVYISNSLNSNIDSNRILKVLKASKVVYEEPIKNNFFYELSILGFKSIYKTIVMSLYLNNFNLKIDELNDNDFKPFVKGLDEKLRCRLQNEIFKEDGRIPLSVEDIFWDEKQSYYIDNMSCFIYDNQIPVGYGQVIYVNNSYTFCNFGILKDYRNRGLGEKLLKYFIKLTKINNIETLYIKVSDKNTEAIKLYKKVGFTTDSIVENFELKQKQ